jgi:hypothetical protein
MAGQGMCACTAEVGLGPHGLGEGAGGSGRRCLCQIAEITWRCGVWNQRSGSGLRRVALAGRLGTCCGPDCKVVWVGYLHYYKMSL